MNKYRIVPTGAFRQDLKLIKRRGYNIDLLETVINLLAAGETLPPKYKDHSLSGSLRSRYS